MTVIVITIGMTAYSYRDLPPGLYKKVGYGGGLPPGWYKRYHQR